ncbi:FMN-binding negative transcriptional regulator [Acidiphilium sp.]|uniref:FMN-binding negative transcriptional regulator n=1 Tax=Acidiphilium sp. TaxID=527 RepID=UPI003D064422
MYTPPAHVEDDPAILAAIMRAARLPILVSGGAGGIEATHLPLTHQPDPAPHGRLIGHLARGNPQWRSLRDDAGRENTGRESTGRENTGRESTGREGANAMAIFQAHDFYVSPNWYETKRETGKVVPTWNYEAVHAYGTIEIIEDATRLRAIVEALTDHHEASQPKPWQVSDAPDDYIASQLKGIVGVVMTITRLIGKRKLSQNRPLADRQGVIAGLTAAGDAPSAALMRSLNPPADQPAPEPSPPPRE